MHVIIGLLTVLAGIFLTFNILQRAGTISQINSFAWNRRIHWKRKSRENPIYTLTDPIEVAGVLLLGVVKCEGEMSPEQKQTILEIFQNDLHLNENEAADLLIASRHLIRDEVHLVDGLNKILRQSLPNFSPAQIQSLLRLMHDVSTLDACANEEQQKLIQSAKAIFDQHQATLDEWS